MGVILEHDFLRTPFLHFLEVQLKMFSLTKHEYLSA